MRLNSAYICVHDTNRATGFYEKFLGQPVTTRDDVFSVFDFHGFRLCLFNNSKVGESVKYGDNCLLSFEVEDAKSKKDELEKDGVEIVYPLTKLGENLVFEFKDTEGNDIEVYSKLNNRFSKTSDNKTS